MPTVRLSGLLSDDRPEDDAIAFGREGERRRAGLTDDVASLAGALAEHAGGAWLVHTEDAYAGAVALLGLWGSGRSALLAPNRQPETLRRIGGQVSGAILDGEAPGLPPTLFRLDPSNLPPGSAPTHAPARDASVAEFRTSGTTGEEKAVAKRLRHLEDEVAILETLFGYAMPASTRIFATVSHQHIYGLLFRLLWPLASGRALLRETLLHPQELLPRMRESDACALVTTPAHLRRMAAGDGLRGLAGVCRAVFSSGAPLDPETAKRVAEQLGESPHEILGSTETGGVAVRQRSAGSESWSAFPGIGVSRDADSLLMVRSPLASEGDETDGDARVFTMGDRVELHDDGTFALLDRADRTVKIGGVRLSLPAMERELEAHEWVNECALVVLDQGGESRVHGVVVPSAAGNRVLHGEGRRALGSGLASHLARGFDRVLLPRAWRTVDELPRNAQGKLPAAELRALFEETRRDPVSMVETVEERILERRIEVPHDLAALQGHFEGRPLVPGVEQLRWAVEAGGIVLGQPACVRGVEALKFPTVLQPGDRATLRVEISPARDRLRFRLFDGERVYATGRCLLGSKDVSDEAAP
jgi:3-hydroxymyristoyl/3-hydroxydecanoyl-(acyl carrier protein) dehydratase